MQERESLYGVTVSSSGLIFAMIVGAWAAYLVPMWLRKQDELNEARPTERFSTAIRRLSGRAAAERRTARDTERREKRAAVEAAEEGGDTPYVESACAADDATPGVADVRAFAEPVTSVPRQTADQRSRTIGRGEPPPERQPDPRATVLARRRRTTMVLFLAFAVGGIFALVTGPGYLWLPVIPGLLLSAYIAHVRTHERRRSSRPPISAGADGDEPAGRLARRGMTGEDGPPRAHLDRDRAEEAARRLRARTQARQAPPARAVVEQTDHAEWVDQQRGQAPASDGGPESWEPAPVPLPTYVTAPVAPRTSRGIDLEASDTWSAARSAPATPADQEQRPIVPDQPRGPQRTPLFDQYADEGRPRAVGE